MTSQPPRAWSGRELAQLLGVKPRNMLTQLGEWAKLGFFTRTGRGTYALNTPGPASSTNATRPLTTRHCCAMRAERSRIGRRRLS